MELISNMLFWLSNGMLIPDIIFLLFFFIKALLMIGGFYGTYIARTKINVKLNREIGKTGVEEFLDTLPGGLDARVGARGLAVSGGEAQRIAIARAFLKNASIMILDEPTAHVDLASVREILASLETVCAGRTTLTISHRDATIKGADRVATLTEGTIR